MNVAQLIEELKKLPPDATVLRQGGEFSGDHRSIQKLEYHEKSSWGMKANTVVIG